ncbi:MAG: hypothetical protein J6S63_09115 [Atopobiaceae bacterium]|nr:hypothetical protein [Atopobiaceae bacterium]
MKKHGIMLTLAMFACVLAVSMVALAGCGGSSTGTEAASTEAAGTEAAGTEAASTGKLIAEVADEGNTYKVRSEGADFNAGIGSDGFFKLEEGDAIEVAAQITKGKLQVSLKDDKGEDTFVQEVSGTQTTTQEVPAGTYGVSVTCLETGTEGTVAIARKTAE